MTWDNEKRSQSFSSAAWSPSRRRQASPGSISLSKSKRLFGEPSSKRGVAGRRGAISAIAGVALSLSTVLGSARLAEAQDETTTEEAPRRAQVEHKGAHGMWFRLDVAREMLGELEEARLLRQRVGLLERRLELSDELIALETRRADLAVEQADTASGSLEAAVRGRRQCEEDLDHFTRQPWFWTAVSAVVGALGVGFGVWVAGEG